MHVAVAHDRLQDRLAVFDIDGDHLVQVGQFDEHAPASERGQAPVVTAAAHHDLELVFAGKFHRGHDIVLVGSSHDHLRRAVRNQLVP